MKAIALAATDLDRAKQFYGETLGLPKDKVNNMDGAYLLGGTFILLKSQDEWYGRPSAELNARVAIEVKDAYSVEKTLRERGVTISDPVQVYESPVGGFLDSEGSKIWFCSNS
ncbi:MAG: VOC family protein [Verrucomicrobiae bacterium]|nr:VOC family protein [Verrucomicrobiae bacterium]